MFAKRKIRKEKQKRLFTQGRNYIKIYFYYFNDDLCKHSSNLSLTFLLSLKVPLEMAKIIKHLRIYKIPYYKNGISIPY